MVVVPWWFGFIGYIEFKTIFSTDYGRLPLAGIWCWGGVLPAVAFKPVLHPPL